MRLRFSIYIEEKKSLGKVVRWIKESESLKERRRRKKKGSNSKEEKEPLSKIRMQRQ